MALTEIQVCSTESCARAAAYTTRIRPAWCLECIADFYRAGGAEPLEPWRDHKTRVPARCFECGYTTAYYFQYVLSKTTGTFTEPICRVCHWDKWAEHLRVHRSPLETELFNLLEADPNSAELAQAVNDFPQLVESIANIWWPTERIKQTLELVHHDLVANTREPNDGTRPVIARCQQCQTESVFLMRRMDSELQGRWCACQSCAQTKPRGTCPRDVQMGFERLGMRAVAPQIGTDVEQDLECLRCGTRRFTSLRQLLGGVVPCFECDGAAKPSSPHKVYLFHFARWNTYKVGITGAYKDSRLVLQKQRGGELVDLLEVPNRGTALAVESNVVRAVRPWPATGEPVDQRVDGWTEMWDASAPIVVQLRTYLPVDYQAPRGSTEVQEPRAKPEVVNSSGVEIGAGTRICVTGTAPGVSRAELTSRLQSIGIEVSRTVNVDTDLLVAQDLDVTTSKIRRAAQLGVPVATYELLIEQLKRLAPGI
ncbi:BRCT domain-containing protein [Demequina aurantiaca]|uniref:BRCT domain-containing protein n=1 Tax=Demequina aurantiaca TaxID=676200 RepID=UPI003D33415A